MPAKRLVFVLKVTESICRPAGVGGCQGCRPIGVFVLWFPKVTGHILSDCILPCCCSSLSHGQSIVFYGFQR